jgi:hypothetical protein
MERSGQTVPVASAGGWSDANTLHVEIVFLETPHRVDIDCSLAERRARVNWRLPPLGGFRLAELHCGLDLRLAGASAEIDSAGAIHATGGQFCKPIRPCALEVPSLAAGAFTARHEPREKAAGDGRER